MIGRTFGHYRILEKIGQGGMGEVFLAEDTSLHRKVALKFLPSALASAPESRKRFLVEAQAAPPSTPHPPPPLSRRLRPQCAAETPGHGPGTGGQRPRRPQPHSRCPAPVGRADDLA